MQKIIIFLCTPLLLMGLLGGCAHKIDVQQGNLVSLESLDKLKVGMSEAQVRFAIGDPMLRDPFHAGRWDYLYQMQRGDGTLDRYRATVYFRDGVVERIERSGELPQDEYQAGRRLMPPED